MSLADHLPDRDARAVPTRRAALIAVFTALSVVGSFIKIPGPVGSIALDSAAGFFVALAFSGGSGAAVIALGHLVSAAIAGFPLTLPLHLAIAVGMAGCAVALRLIGRRSLALLVAAIVVVTLLNSVVLGLVVLPVGGTGLYLATLPSLAIGAVVNLVIAAAAWWTLRDSRLLAGR